MAEMQPRRKALVFAALFPTLIALSGAEDTLFPGDPLKDDSSLISSDGSFKLGFFTPGKSKFRFLGIWYNQIPVQTVVWVANRDSPLPDRTGVLSISINGSLSLSDSKGVVYWSTPSTRLAGPVAKLLDDANFFVAGAGGGGNAWQSFDHPTDTLLPGMKLWVDRRTGFTRNFTSWKSDDDPGTGDSTLFLNPNGVPQMILVQGSKRVWRSGLWVGKEFSGIPEKRSYEDFNFSVISNDDEAYYQFTTRDKTVLSRLVVQSKGMLQRLIWIKDKGTWNVYYFAPKEPCDAFGHCGIFGICDPNESPTCSCLQGFEPRLQDNWNLRDWNDGCRRRTPVDCKNNTDGFVLVANAKLPDTSVEVVIYNMGTDECREECLRNCSCAAYTTDVSIEGGGSRCILWNGVLTDLRVFDNGGQDLFVRLARADLYLSPSKENRGRVVAAVSAAAAVVVVILLLGLVAGLVRRRRKTINTVVLGKLPVVKSQTWNEEMARSREMDLPLFDLAVIAAGTNHFSTDNLLGEGGFGPVYKGRLEGNQEVAVKRLAKSSSQGVEQFMNEVRLIAKLQHRNLVRLLGCCVDGEERMLVYEYMPNGSLDSFIFSQKNKRALLDWATRWRIILGVARGLLYLHQDSRLRIIHRDLKAGNVLLDGGMNPKISDFGLAHIFPGDETEGKTRTVVGTYGYMSPEYAMDGTFSVKSDVFSFGVLILEIISGRKNKGIVYSDPNLNLLGYAWSLWEEGKGLELVDSSLGYPISMAEVLRCIEIALLCVQDRPEDRPEMAAVVLMLGGDRAPSPHPKQPEFVSARERSEDSSSSKGPTCTVNDVTLSAVHGR